MVNKNDYQKELDVQELGFLIITPDKLGVTRSLDDVNAILGRYLDDPYTPVIVIPGETGQLLEYAHKLLCVDNILSMQGGQFNYPALPEADTLFNRSKADHQDGLRHIISRF